MNKIGISFIRESIITQSEAAYYKQINDAYFAPACQHEIEDSAKRNHHIIKPYEASYLAGGLDSGCDNYLVGQGLLPARAS